METTIERKDWLSYRWVVLVVCWMGYCVTYMSRLGLGPLGTFMRADLAINKAQFGVFSSAVGAGLVVALIPAGWLIDRLGIRVVLTFGQLIGGIALIGMFFTRTYVEALSVMFLAGMCMGCVMPCPSSAVVHWFPAKERGMAIGINQTANNFGGMVTAASFPIIATAHGWRTGFMLLGFVAIIFGIVSSVFYRNPPKGGTGVMSGPAPAVLKKESSFIVLKSRDIWFATIAAVCLTVNEFSVFNYYVMYLKEHLLVAVVPAGFLLGTIDAGGLCAKPIAGIISDRLFGGKRKGTFFLLALIATVLTIIIAVLPVGTPQWVLLICSAVFGFAGVGWAGICFTMIGEFAGREHVGVVTGITIAAMIIVSIFGVPMFGHIADKTHGWTWSWVYAAGLGAIATIIIPFIREERKRLQV